MKNKKLKDGIGHYIEIQADHLPSSENEKNLTVLDNKIYEVINGHQGKTQPSSEWSWRKVSALAASFVLIISISLLAVFIINKEPEQIAADHSFTVIISYANEQYGYYSNRVIIDKYGLGDISDLKQTPELFTGHLEEADILQADSVFDRNNIVGGKIYPYSEDVIILQSGDHLYYFERITTE